MVGCYFKFFPSFYVLMFFLRKGNSPSSKIFYKLLNCIISNFNIELNVKVCPMQITFMMSFSRSFDIIDQNTSITFLSHLICFGNILAMYNKSVYCLLKHCWNQLHECSPLFPGCLPCLLLQVSHSLFYMYVRGSSRK